MVPTTVLPKETAGIGEFKVAVNSAGAFQEAYGSSIAGTPAEPNIDSIPLYFDLTGSEREPKRELLAQKREILDLAEAEKPSRAFAEFTIRRNVKEMLGLLGELKLNLDKPEGAVAMGRFRQNLTEAWKVKDPLPKERILLLSAVEEVIRGRKWRELTTGQIEVLERIVWQAGYETLTPKRMAEVFRTIHKSGMDIYPASAVDEDDDEGE